MYFFCDLFGCFIVFPYLCTDKDLNFFKTIVKLINFCDNEN